MGRAFKITKDVARSLLPEPAWRRIRGFTKWPSVGFVRFGSLRRLTPISKNWGANRGIPIDRYYIEQFLSEWASDIRGCVLEVHEDRYARQFGSVHVKNVDILSVVPNHPVANIIADLNDAKDIPQSSYDCIILTQTLQLIYNYDAAIRTLHRILRPGGVALVTVPGISKIARDEEEGWSTQWHFTEQSARKAFATIFGEQHVMASSHGNVLAATAFLYGLALCELSEKELQHRDPDFPLIIEIRAQRANITPYEN
jgi:SAM-dependent methyltransferase